MFQQLLRAGLALAALPLLAGLARADFTASGHVEYQDRPFSYSGGFSSQTNVFLPVRRARVQVLDANTNATLATGATDENGNFAIGVSGSGTKNIKVRVFSRSDAFGNNRVRVTNSGNSLYSVDSTTFTGHNMNTDLAVGTIQALKITTGSLQANPFNMLDQMVWGVQYVLNSGAPNLPNSIRMVWPGGGGSFASGTIANMSDDDGYDDCVQLHELGHVLHNIYSDSDSPGGSHGFGQSDQDPRLSFGEGWASFFGASVRQFAGLAEPGIYVDAFGGGSGGVQLRVRYESGTPYTGTTGGEADEVAVAAALWDVIDRADTLDTTPGTDDDALDGGVLFGSKTPDQKHWEVFTGPVDTAPNLTIRNMWDGFFVPQTDGNLAEMQAIFEAWKIRVTSDAAEPNNGVTTATPLATSSSFGPTRSLYFATSAAGAPGAGDVDFYRVTFAAGTVFDVETRYPGGKSDAETYADVRLDVFTPTGALLGADDDSGAGRNAKLESLVASTAGDYLVRVSSDHSYRVTGGYELRVRTTSVPSAPPVVTTVVPDKVPAVPVDTTPQLVLTGTGFDAVTDVRIDGISMAGFPPQFFAISDTQLNVFMPLVSKTGPVTIELISTGGTTTTTVDVEINEPPVVDMYGSDPGFLLTSTSMTLVASGAPGDFVYIAASTSNAPSPLPGIVDLAIGNGGTELFVLGKHLIGAQGYVQKSYPLAGLTPGLEFYVQNAVLRVANGYALPATATNVQKGTILF